jgi:hypothetical protein
MRIEVTVARRRAEPFGSARSRFSMSSAVEQWVPMSVLSLVRARMGVLMLLAVFGCSKTAPPLVPVAGKLEYRGKPMADVTVQFVPDTAKNQQGMTATAQTGNDGSFRLQTLPHGDGALPGIYRITLVAYPGRQPFPVKYTRSDKTSLIVEIPPEGKSDLAIKLKD